MTETVNVALFAAIAAIVAPSLAAIIQCIFQYKTKKLELTHDKRTKVFLSLIEHYQNFVVAPELVGTSIVLQKVMDASLVAKRRRLCKCLIALAEEIKREKRPTETVAHLFDKCLPQMYKEI